MGSTQTPAPLLAETKFNINHQVRVKLTDRGKEVLLEDVLSRPGTASNAEALRSIKALYQRDDEYNFQLYELMAIFGPTLPTFGTSNAKFYPFEGNNITLLPDPYAVARHVS